MREREKWSHLDVVACWHEWCNGCMGDVSTLGRKRYLASRLVFAERHVDPTLWSALSRGQREQLHAEMVRARRLLGATQQFSVKSMKAAAAFAAQECE